MGGMNIDLHIEQLRLDGFAPGDRYRIGGAVRDELRRLIAKNGIPRGLSQGLDMARLNGGSFNAAPGSKPQAIGRQVANSVYKGLGR